MTTIITPSKTSPSAKQIVEITRTASSKQARNTHVVSVYALFQVPVL